MRLNIMQTIAGCAFLHYLLLSANCIIFCLTKISEWLCRRLWTPEQVVASALIRLVRNLFFILWIVEKVCFIFKEGRQTFAPTRLHFLRYKLGQQTIAPTQLPSLRYRLCNLFPLSLVAKVLSHTSPTYRKLQLSGSTSLI